MEAKDNQAFLIKKETMIMKNTRKFKEVYKIGKSPLGQGGFGVVYKCEHRTTKQIRAVKIVSKKKIKNMEKFQLEITILQKLDHPNVLKLFEYFDEDKDIYLVTERCKGGELFDRIVEENFFSEYDSAKIFRQILQSLNYCHTQGIAHRDIKPENFLFETKSKDSDIKIIDFGLSRILSSKDEGKGKKGLERMDTKAGTPSYVSPEVLAGNYGIECDMWSAGCVLYILLCGYPPFYGDDDYELCQNVIKGKFEMDGEEWDEISKEAKNLIKSLICKPEKRLTAGEALNHKWFKKALGDDMKVKIDDKMEKKLSQFQNYGDNSNMAKAALTAISV